MFVSSHLDAQDIKNQKIVLKDFLSLQKNENGSPSFKAYAQGFPIKIATPEGKKFFYPFDQAISTTILVIKGDKL